MGGDFSCIHGECRSFLASKVEIEVYLEVGICIYDIAILYLWLLKAALKEDHLKIILPKLLFYRWVTNPVPFTKCRSPS